MASFFIPANFGALKWLFEVLPGICQSTGDLGQMKGYFCIIQSIIKFGISHGTDDVRRIAHDVVSKFAVPQSLQVLLGGLNKNDAASLGLAQSIVKLHYCVLKLDSNYGELIGTAMCKNYGLNNGWVGQYLTLVHKGKIMDARTLYKNL